MKSRRILVTGGCGFIGTHFIRMLLSGDDYPAILVNVDALTYAGCKLNLESVENHPAYFFHQGDMGDETAVAALLKTHEIDTVVHFAAESHVDRSIDSPEPFFDTNVMGTLRLLNVFRRHWEAQSRDSAYRFLHISTDEVFGTLKANDPPFHEATPYAPNSPYAASKAASDHIVRAFHQTYGLPVLTTHCSNNFGPWQFPEKLIPLMILNALEGKPLPVYGDGMQVRDWLYVEDHVRAILCVLAGGQPGQCYNIGGGTELPNIQLVQAICDILQQQVPRTDGLSYRELITHVTDRPGHDLRYAINSGKIQEELGWQPEESLASGLVKTIDWYLTNPAWVDAVTHKGYARERLGLQAESGKA